MTKEEAYKLREHINAALHESFRQSGSKNDKEYEAYSIFQRRLVKASQDLEKWVISWK